MDLRKSLAADMSMGDGSTGIIIFLAFFMYVSNRAPYIAAGTSIIVISFTLDDVLLGRDDSPLILAFVIGLDESKFNEDA